jgi:AFG3 family protein
VQSRSGKEYFDFAFGITASIVQLVFLAWLMSRIGISLSQFSRMNRDDSVSKSIKKFSVEKNLRVTFSEVAGCENPKLEMMEFVDFLKNPDKYHKAGARLPKGALLGGPPGTGKTLMAKACAGESNVPFFYISGSDFVEKYVGVGASRVRKLFEAARKEAPAIVFIDEIDAVGRQRSASGGGERDSTLNQLLVEMDGFSSKDNVVVFAASNRLDILDKALKRPGRFDRMIEFTLPNLEERAEIYLVHLKQIKTAEPHGLIAKKLAPLSTGFSGADIMNVCNEAAIIAARDTKLAVDLLDFEKAIERVLGGLERKGLMSAEEKKLIAVHEAGKAVASWFLPNGPTLLKLSIIPRSKSALGFSQYLPADEKLQSEPLLRDTICYQLGGRVAEELFFNEITTGAQKELEKCYEIAWNIVTQYAMAKSLYNVRLHTNEYGEKSFSQKTGRVRTSHAARRPRESQDHRRRAGPVQSDPDREEAAGREARRRAGRQRNARLRADQSNLGRKAVHARRAHLEGAGRGRSRSRRSRRP